MEEAFKGVAGAILKITHPNFDTYSTREFKFLVEFGVPEWTAHDLRRTFATQLGEALNVDPVVVEKCLGHKMPRIMAEYNKNEMLPQRKDALEKWSQKIEEMIG